MTLSPGMAYLPIGEGPPNLSSVDWDSAPTRFKQYSRAQRQCLTHRGVNVHGSLDLFLLETAGLTRQRFKVPESLGESLDLSTVKAPARQAPDLLRIIPSGGALHPHEVYLISHQDPDLSDGIYHYNAIEHSLECLTDHAVAPILARALDAKRVASKTLIVTCCFSRNAYKYGDFGYRVQSMDLGIVIGQARAAAERQGWSSAVRYQFDDAVLDRLLGLEAEFEASYAVLEIGEVHGVENAEAEHPTMPMADSRTAMRLERWPHLERIHVAARQPMSQRCDGSSWVKTAAQANIALPTVETPEVSLDALRHRQSAMHAFAHQVLTLEQATLLFRAVSVYTNDTIHAAHSDLYAMVNTVSGLKSGIYRYQAGSHHLELMRDGDTRAALSRTFGGPSQNAFEISLGLFVVGNFKSGLAAGDRWYRVQNMDAGSVVARLYRTATALGLACHANLNYKLHTANRELGLCEPWTSLIQVLIGGIASNGRKLDVELMSETPARERSAT